MLQKDFLYTSSWVTSSVVKDMKTKYWVWTLTAQACKKASSDAVIWAYVNSVTSDKLITLLNKSRVGKTRIKGHDTLLYVKNRENEENCKPNNQSTTVK